MGRAVFRLVSQEEQGNSECLSIKLNGNPDHGLVVFSRDKSGMLFPYYALQGLVLP